MIEVVYDDTHNMVSKMRTKMKAKKCECDEAEYLFVCFSMELWSILIGNLPKV